MDLYGPLYRAKWYKYFLTSKFRSCVCGKRPVKNDVLFWSVIGGWCQSALITIVGRFRASVAQLVELLICNQWVGGSSPFAGSSLI